MTRFGCDLGVGKFKEPCKGPQITTRDDLTPSNGGIHSPMLSGPRQRFAEGVASGLSAAQAYRAAYPTAKRSEAAKNTSRLTKNDEVKAEIVRIRAAAALLPGSAVLTLVEKREFFARVVRAKLKELPDDSDLWQEITITADSIKRKLPDKLRAIHTDNDLAAEGSGAGAADALTELMKTITARGPV